MLFEKLIYKVRVFIMENKNLVNAEVEAKEETTLSPSIKDVKEIDALAEIKKLNLFEKICMISSEVEYLQKDDKVGYGNNSYKAISIEKVVGALGKKISYYGLVIFTSKQVATRKDEEVPSVDKSGNHIIKYNRVTDVEVQYTIVNAHNPSEQIVVCSNGTGVDSQDKGIGKAMTYAYKNMLIKLFNIPTGEDTDKIHSEEYSNKIYGDTQSQADVLYSIAQKNGITPNQVNGGCNKYYSKLPNQLTNAEFEEMKTRLNKSKK